MSQKGHTHTPERTLQKIKTVTLVFECQADFLWAESKTDASAYTRAHRSEVSALLRSTFANA
jgi:hypothetical protein